MPVDLCKHLELPESCDDCKVGQNGHHSRGRARASLPTLVGTTTEEEQEQREARPSFFRSAGVIAADGESDQADDWPVPGLLGPGLTLFFAAAKIGKTRMLTDIGWNVASGNPALGSLMTHQGDVLMVLSETPDADLRGMWAENWPDETPPTNLSVCSQEQWYGFVDWCRSRTDDHGNPGRVSLYWMLQEWYEAADNPSLVVIDNLTNCVLNHQQVDQRKRPQVLDYEAQTAIRRWSREREVPVVLLHHTNQTRLEKGDDWTYMSAGTGGINSVPDHLMLLRETEEGGLVLNIKGRRIAKSSYDLVWRGSNIFMFDPVKVSPRLGSKMNEILRAMSLTPVPGQGTPEEVAQVSGLPYNTVKTYLQRLLNDGLVTRPERGLYQIRVTGEQQ